MIDTWLPLRVIVALVAQYPCCPNLFRDSRKLAASALVCGSAPASTYSYRMSLLVSLLKMVMNDPASTAKELAMTR
ncbi:hypothetical protein [Variovorax sp.]|uniref:hypothetical protein n=1 Tax=Variovorax sp. TaxID=1871043 RepID=UPI0025D1964A|nr:hypothetical protein [Variovorax sp.]